MTMNRKARRGGRWLARILGRAVDVVLLGAAAVLLLGPGGWVRERASAWSAERSGRAALVELWPEVAGGGGVLSPGPAGGPVLVEFTDYRCPWCARGQAALDSVAAAGGVRVRVRQLPVAGLHPDAPALARVAVCAERTGAFAEVHRALYGAPRALTDEALEELLAGAGVEQPAEVLRCAASPWAERRVEADLGLARRLGLRATPSFVTEGDVRAGALSSGALLRMSGLPAYDVAAGRAGGQTR